MKLCVVPFILFQLLVEVYCGEHDLIFKCIDRTIINCKKSYLLRNTTTTTTTTTGTTESSRSSKTGMILVYPELCQKGKGAGTYDDMQKFIDEVIGSEVLIHAGTKRRTVKKWLRTKTPIIYKMSKGEMFVTVSYAGLFEPTDDTQTDGLKQAK